MWIFTMKVTEVNILIICFWEGNCNSRRSSFAEKTEQISFKEIFFLKTKQHPNTRLSYSSCYCHDSQRENLTKGTLIARLAPSGIYGTRNPTLSKQVNQTVGQWGFCWFLKKTQESAIQTFHMVKYCARQHYQLNQPPLFTVHPSDSCASETRSEWALHHQMLRSYTLG